MVKTERLKCVGLKKGPSLKTIRKALNQALNGCKKPTIPVFSNGYRDFPIQLAGVEIVAGVGKQLVVNIFGQTNWRDTGKKVPGCSAVVKNYSPHLRTADGILML